MGLVKSAGQTLAVELLDSFQFESLYCKYDRLVLRRLKDLATSLLIHTNNFSCTVCTILSIYILVVLN